MADAADYLRNAIVAAYFRSPATVYLALFDGPLTTDELTDTGYARQAVTFASPSTPGESANTNVCTFGPFDGAGTITHAALYDAVSGGNALTVPVAVAEAVAFVADAVLSVPADGLDLAVT